MDIFAHYFWAVALYWGLRKEPKWWLGISGALPDLLSFGILFATALLTGTRYFGSTRAADFPQWIYSAYDVTHSLVIALAIMGIIALVSRKHIYLMYGWILHILCDIPTHRTSFFPTPFLWPISSFHVSGISWAEPWFMVLNWAAIAGTFTWLALRERRLRGSAVAKKARRRRAA